MSVISSTCRAVAVTGRLCLCFFVLFTAQAGAAVSPPQTHEVLAISAAEGEQVDALQQKSEILGNWEVVAVEGGDTEQQSLVGDIWTFNSDASFLSRQQGQHKGDAHYTLNPPRLEISQPQSRKQYLLQQLQQDEMRLLEINRLSTQQPGDDAQAAQRVLLFHRSDQPAGQGPASIYYTPRQVATLQVLLSCGQVSAEQLQMLYPARTEADSEVKPRHSDDKPAAASPRSGKAKRQKRNFEAELAEAKELAKQHQVSKLRREMDEYLFAHVGIPDFEWPLYLSSKHYYEADPVYNSVFPGIIKRGIRRCLN